MKEINLYNRDGASLKMVSENGEDWHLEVDEKHEYILQYMRVGFAGSDPEDKTIEFIDPSGGPMISVGDKLDMTRYIKAIEIGETGTTIKTGTYES